MDKDLAELVQKINGHDPDSEEAQDCVRCGDPYTLADGTEPTALCHPCAQITVAELVEAVSDHPAHPAIPEDVLRAIAWMIEPYFDKPMPCREGLDKATFLRDWLAKCPGASDQPLPGKVVSLQGGGTATLTMVTSATMPQASDKAVCPKCGANCHRCGEHTPFSPPRGPKVTP